MPAHSFSLRTVATLLTFLAAGAARLSAADRIELTEAADDNRVFAVTSQVDVAGKYYPQPGAQNEKSLEARAEFSYSERRLEGTGRDAQALRTVRYYNEAGVAITVGTVISNSRLRETLRLIVAQGQEGGVELFSPSGPLTFNELELIRSPADTLAVLALLPTSAVEPGESWKPAEWVLPLLTEIEAAEKSTLTCKLESVQNNVARVTIQGEITGAALRAAAAIKVTGHLLYDLENKHISRVALEHAVKRDVGYVSPGLDVTAKAVVVRRLDPAPARLTEKNLANVPLEANPATRLLMFDAPAWNVRFHHDRGWHLFNQNSDSAVLRMLDRKDPVYQCNIKKLPDAERGQHVPEEKFEADVKQTLGEALDEIVEARRVKVRDDLYVFRVVAVGRLVRKSGDGKASPIPQQWNYYLVANADGRQLAFVFTLEPEWSEQFSSRDLGIIGGVEFLAPRAKVIQPAGGRK